MQSYKFLALVTVLVACALTVQAYPRQFQQPLEQRQFQPQEQRAILPDEAAGASSADANHDRQKKFAIISSYSALPAAYSAFPYSSFSYLPAATYPSFYSSPYSSTYFI